MKKLVSMILAIAIMLSGFSAFCAQETPVTVYVDGVKINFDVDPIIDNGRTLVPMRYIFEALGATVEWRGETSTAVAKKDGDTIRMVIGENVFYKNDIAVPLDVPACIVNGRTLVPVRAIAESFDCEVKWYEKTKKVDIKYSEPQEEITDNTSSQNNVSSNQDKSGQLDEFKQKVVDLVNIERKNAGLGALKVNKLLEETAQQHSDDMAQNSYFSHENLKGETPFDRMRKNGIVYMSAGENVAMGQPTPEDVMEAWMNSPGHRANILKESYSEIGVGIAKNEFGQLYWTQNFIG